MTVQDHSSFIYDGAVWTPLNSSAPYTQARDISGQNIVGSTWSGTGPYHGFLYDGTNWSTLDYPGASNTFPEGISGNKVVGRYMPSGGRYYQGFLFDGTAWTSLSHPEGYETFPYGIDGDNIVGMYYPTDGGPPKGFLYNGSTWTTLLYPESRDTRPHDIDGNNIVGWYQDAETGRYQGFLYDGMSWQALKGSGLQYTFVANGIFGNTVVGDYAGDAIVLILPEPATLLLLALGGLAVMPRR